MKKVFVVLSCVLALGIPSLASAQATTPPDRDKVKAAVEQTQAIKTKIEEAQGNPRFVRTLTNVQVELTLTDQLGTAAPEKKTVSMIVSSGNWGKIRSAGTVRPVGDAPFAVVLNVDARPFVSIEGPVQLELTVEYFPAPAPGDPREGPKPRPMGVNQSQTVVLQSGKPLIISQAADPLIDRKVVVEVKATVLK
jgi:hypothetical protein